MADTDQEMREKLHEIWGEWGLQSEHASVEAQLDALAPIHAWLNDGASRPEIVIRAVQCLLADPERPGLTKRPCWTFVRKEIEKHWASVSTATGSVSLVQAMLLAAWPCGSKERALLLASLFDGAWEVIAGREREREALSQWRDEVRALASEKDPLFEYAPAPREMSFSYAGLDLTAPNTALQTIQSQPNTQWQYSNNGQLAIQVLAGHKAALEQVGKALSTLTEEIGTVLEQQAQSNVTEIRNALVSLDSLRAEADLLWWGQARYCRPLKKPYRRIEDADEALWWAAWEAAGIARDVEVEPAAAFLVETLNGLGHKVGEKRPLGRWLESLHQCLTQADEHAPALSERLARVTKEDALGLPVSWVRVQAARRDPLKGAAAALLLPLDAEIDRGQWASWVFREVLLDLHLGEEE